MKERVVSCGEVLHRNVYPERWRKNTRALVYGIDTMNYEEAGRLLQILIDHPHVKWRVPTRLFLPPSMRLPRTLLGKPTDHITLEPLP